MRTRLGSVIAAVVVILCLSCAHRAPESSAVRFRYQVIDADGPYEIHVTAIGDLNGDGQSDLLAAGTDGQIVWYEYPKWTKHTIARGGGSWSTEAQIGDIDRDGDNDLVISDWYQNKRIVWFENCGGDWKLHPLGLPNAHDVKLADLDRDGDLDVVTRRETFENAAGHSVEIWIQDSPLSWRHRSLPVPPGEGLQLADVDADRDLDILIGARWYENSGGDPAASVWREHLYSKDYRHPAAFPFLTDINGDGINDIVLTPSKPQEHERYRISWFAGTGHPKEVWPEHVVADGVEALQHSVFAADMDNDGDNDIVTAEMHQSIDPDEIALYLNSDGKGGKWRKQVVATTGSHFLRVADLGNDGDFDLFSANWSGTRKLELWENLTANQ